MFPFFKCIFSFLISLLPLRGKQYEKNDSINNEWAKIKFPSLHTLNLRENNEMCEHWHHINKNCEMH